MGAIRGEGRGGGKARGRGEAALLAGAALGLLAAPSLPSLARPPSRGTDSFTVLVEVLAAAVGFLWASADGPSLFCGSGTGDCLEAAEALPRGGSGSADAMASKAFMLGFGILAFTPAAGPDSGSGGDVVVEAEEGASAGGGDEVPGGVVGAEVGAEVDSDGRAPFARNLRTSAKMALAVRCGSTSGNPSCKKL